MQETSDSGHSNKNCENDSQRAQRRNDQKFFSNRLETPVCSDCARAGRCKGPGCVDPSSKFSTSIEIFNLAQKYINLDVSIDSRKSFAIETPEISEGLTIKTISSLARNFQSRSKISISTSNRFPHKNRAAVGGSLEKFILARNFQSRSKSRLFFLIFGPSGKLYSKVDSRNSSQRNANLGDAQSRPKRTSTHEWVHEWHHEWAHEIAHGRTHEG